MNDISNLNQDQVAKIKSKLDLTVGSQKLRDTMREVIKENGEILGINDSKDLTLHQRIVLGNTLGYSEIEKIKMEFALGNSGYAFRMLDRYCHNLKKQQGLNEDQINEAIANSIYFEDKNRYRHSEGILEALYSVHNQALSNEQKTLIMINLLYSYNYEIISYERMETGMSGEDIENDIEQQRKKAKKVLLEFLNTQHDGDKILIKKGEMILDFLKKYNAPSMEQMIDLTNSLGVPSILNSPKNRFEEMGIDANDFRKGTYDLFKKILSIKDASDELKNFAMGYIFEH